MGMHLFESILFYIYKRFTCIKLFFLSDEGEGVVSRGLQSVRKSGGGVSQQFVVNGRGER